MGDGWPLKIAKKSVDEWCKFEIKPAPQSYPNSIVLWSPHVNRYVSAVGEDWPLKIAKTKVDEWCIFTLLEPITTP